MEMKIEDILKLNSLIENTYLTSIHEAFEIPAELKETHIKALVLIASNKRQTMSQISNGLGLEKGSFTPVANRLIEKEYIVKEKSREDKRASYLTMTEKGLKFIMNFEIEMKAHMERKLNKLSEEEQEIYFAAIRLVYSLTKKIDNSK